METLNLEVLNGSYMDTLFFYNLLRVLLTGAPGTSVKLTIKGNYYHKRILLFTLLSINYTISMH